MSLKSFHVTAIFFVATTLKKYQKMAFILIFKTFRRIPIKAALADRKKVVRGGFFLVFPFLVFEKSVVVAAMAAWAEAVQGQG